MKIVETINNNFKKMLAVITALIFLALIVNLYEFSNPQLVASFKSFVDLYGISAGFAVTMFGSLWFLPFPYELVLAPSLTFYSPVILPILVFTLAATVADFFNFQMGKTLGERYVKQHLKPSTLKKIEGFLEEYGLYTLLLFAVVGPFTSYDVVAFFFGGFSRLDIKKFMPITFLCRFVHILVVFALIDVLARLAGL